MLSVGEIFDVCGGRLYADNKSIVSMVKKFRLDSRSVCEGDCFVAMKGEKTNGNIYVEDAVRNGARLIITEEMVREDTLNILEKAALLQVKNIYDALAVISSYYRKKEIPYVIAVTGSVGKTTVKELTASVFGTRERVHKTEGNYNNELGLPLSILSRTDEKVSVLELGISDFSEMERLSKIAAPNLCIITNIGLMHLENFKSRENLAKEKLKIISAMEDGGTLIVPMEEVLLTENKNLPKNTYTVSICDKGANYYGEIIGKTVSGNFFDVYFNGEKKYGELFVPIIGAHGVMDAMFAVAAADILGYRSDEIAKGLSAYIPCGLRQKVIEYNGKSVLCDCYNAGPQSMIASIEAFLEMCEVRNSQKRMMLLGSMLELGDISAEEHIKIGHAVALSGAETLITVGRDAENIAVGAAQEGMNKDNIYIFTDSEYIAAAKELFMEKLKEHDAVLIKGSRGIKLERFLDFIPYYL